jgi:uncharacterized Zn finger protein
MKSEQTGTEGRVASYQIQVETETLTHQERWQKVVEAYARMGVSLVSDWNAESSQKLVMDYAEMGIYLDPANYDDQDNRSQI